MNNSNEFNSEPPVNQLPNFTNNLSSSIYHHNNSSNYNRNNLSNRYYMLANLSPVSSVYNTTEDNVQPHNRLSTSSSNRTRNNSRSNIINAAITNYMSYLHQSSSSESESRINQTHSPNNNRSEFENNVDLNDNSFSGNIVVDNNHNQPLRILRNYYNDVNIQAHNNNNNNQNNYNQNNSEDKVINSNSSDNVNELINLQTSDRNNASNSLESELLSQNTEELPFNWQSSKCTIRERISAMFNNNHLADVYFIVGQKQSDDNSTFNNNIKRIPAHQFILAISSAVFDAMFNGPLSANKSSNKSVDDTTIKDSEMCNSEINNNPVPSSSNSCGSNNVDNSSGQRDLNLSQHLLKHSLNGDLERQILEIAVPDVEPVAFLALLKFIYTDEVLIGPETVMTTLYASKKYGVATLERYCVDYLKVNLCSDNAFMLLTQARLFNEIQLTNQCLDVIDKNTTDALAADGFLDIDIDTLCTVLDRDTLGIREIKLFQAVMRWADHQIAKDSLVESSDGRSTNRLRTLLEPTLGLIRFPIMSADDFANYVAQSGLLTDRELVNMFLYFLTNNTNNTSNDSNNIDGATSTDSVNNNNNSNTKIPYKDTPRCCLTGCEQIINRYPVIEQRWGYSGTSDRIRFMVDRKIFVVGFGLYGSAQGPSEYQVLIEVLQQEAGTTLATNYLTFKCDGTNRIFNVKFKEPVEISPNVNYIACATLKGPDSYYGSIGYQKVIHESAAHGKVTFQFYYAAGNNNGTSVEDGQIPQIIFYM